VIDVMNFMARSILPPTGSRKLDSASGQLVAAATRLAFSSAVFWSCSLLVPLRALRKEAA
jgi:hypothetical protein